MCASADTPSPNNWTKDTTMATFKVSTKPDKDSAAVQTSLTIDFEGVSEEILREIATSAIVIKWQGQVRKNGIPASATIRALDYRPGTRIQSGPVSFAQLSELVTRMTAEEKAVLLAKLAPSE
jgi:hypothetical protein